MKRKVIEKVIDEIEQVGGLKRETATDRLAENIVYLIDTDRDPKEMIKTAMRIYLENCEWRLDEAELERIVSGMMAFVWTNLLQEPYCPVDMFPVEAKKWYQFWK